MSQSRSTKEIETALGKHVAPFSDAEGNFNPTTVAHGLERAHEPHSTLKGMAIAGFNAGHVGCPFFRAKFVKDKDDYAKNLHLGTTRVWRADGSIDEARWQALVDFTTQGQDVANGDERVVRMSDLKAYLAECLAKDPEESETGRNAKSIGSSKAIQRFAATAAWDEVFDVFRSGVKPFKDNPSQVEPYITVGVMRKFFDNTEELVEKAEKDHLQIAKIAY